MLASLVPVIIQLLYLKNFICNILSMHANDGKQNFLSSHDTEKAFFYFWKGVWSVRKEP